MTTPTIPTSEVARVLQEGLSLACATCGHYWRGVREGRETCTAPGPCIGPFGGGSFEHYQGPIRDFSTWCLRCGDPSVTAIRVAGQERAFGLCRLHEKGAHTIAPAEGFTSHLLEKLAPTGLVSITDLVRRPRPSSRRSVTQLLQEVEGELAERKA